MKRKIIQKYSNFSSAKLFSENTIKNWKFEYFTYIIDINSITLNLIGGKKCRKKFQYF